MRILYDNLADEAICTSSGERSGFPATNVQHPFLIRRWRSLTATAQWVKFDAGTGLTITTDTFAIIQHNLTSAATISVQANSIDDWAAPPVDHAATWDSAIIMLNLAAAESYRFWRIYIEDAANPDGYIEIGRMGLFVRYQAAELPDAGIIDDLEDATVISRSITGQTYADLGVKSRAYEINMGTMKEETRQSLKAIYAAAGQSGRIIFIPDEYNTDKLPPIYCCMKKTPKFTQAGGWLWKHESIRVVEEF